MVDAPPPARRTRRPSEFHKVMEPLLAPALKRRGFAGARLIMDWAEIVGPQLAQQTIAEKVTFPRGKTVEGTLYIRVSSAFAPEVQHKIPQILDRIATYYGYGAIADVRLRQGLPSAPPPPKTVASVALDSESEDRLQRTVAAVDPDLQASLSAIGARVMQRAGRTRTAK